MSKKDKKIEALRNLKHGQSAKIEDVIVFCKKNGIDIVHAKTGSHYLIRHKLVSAFGKFYSLPDVVDTISIPESNNKVYQQWVTRVIKFVDFKEKIESLENEKSKKP